MAGAGPAQLDIGKLPLEQLSQLREQLIDENQLLTNSYQQLQVATKRFEESREALKSIVPENVGTPVMVPITQSLYVRGSLANADSVMVDVGTGYYVEKTVGLAEDYLTRKVKWCQENSGRLEVNILDKRKNVDAVTTVMQMKMQQQQQQQAAAAK